MDKLHEFWNRVLARVRRIHRQEEGQGFVLLAIMMVVLLVFAGLALDTGLIYVRRIQLSRALDAAALACVTEMPDLAQAETRAKQFMRANGINPDTQLRGFDVGAGIPNAEVEGLNQEHIVTISATWRVNTNFMHLVGWDYVDLMDSASAEFRAYIEMFTSQTGESGKLGPVNLSVFGPWQTPSYGDACSCDKMHVANQGGTYRPDEDDVAPPNPNQVAVCPRQGSYPFRVHVPAGVDRVRIEILDPDTYNAPNPPGNRICVSDTLPVTATTCLQPWPDISSYSRANAYSYERASSDTDPNRFWFVRMDEYRRYNETYNHGDQSQTSTDFQLYYLGDDGRVNIALYTGLPNNNDHTDMTWVCPGGSVAGVDPSTAYGSFEVDVSTLDDIITHEDGSRSLYLEVTSTSGWSENGFDLWAGEADWDDANDEVMRIARLYPDVNARNVYIDRQRSLGVGSPHNSHGVGTFGRGILPLNVNQNVTYQVTLAYIPHQARGMDLCVYHWDTDVGSEHVCYILEGHPLSGLQGSNCNAGEVEGQLSGGNSWTSDYGNYNYTEGCDNIPLPDDFVGGYLYARYKMGRQDTSTWTMEFENPVPGSSFVRLID